MSFAPQPLPLLPPHEQLESSETTRQKDVKKHKENIRNFVHVTGVEAEGDLMQMDNVQRMMPPPALVPQQAPPPSLFLATYNNVKGKLKGREACETSSEGMH